MVENKFDRQMESIMLKYKHSIRGNEDDDDDSGGSDPEFDDIEKEAEEDDEIEEIAGLYFATLASFS